MKDLTLGDLLTTTLAELGRLRFADVASGLRHDAELFTLLRAPEGMWFGLGEWPVRSWEIEGYILEHPDEPLVWAKYADWLDEHGNEELAAEYRGLETLGMGFVLGAWRVLCRRHRAFGKMPGRLVVSPEWLVVLRDHAWERSDFVGADVQNYMGDLLVCGTPVMCSTGVMEQPR